MAKIIYCCVRNPSAAALLEPGIRRACRALSPDNIPGPALQAFESGGIIWSTCGPISTAPRHQASVLLGSLYESAPMTWWLPKSPLPDGTYALFRANDELVEVATDTVGTRSVWYYLDDELFLAATSQRAIAMVRGVFDPNPEVIPWILSSGSLGPEQGWCKGVRRLAPDSVATLDRREWRLAVRSESVAFDPATPVPAAEQSLLDAMEDTIAAADMDPRRWAVPLSGGYDSRALLLLMHRRLAPEATPGDQSDRVLNTITWGAAWAQSQRGNDARVARTLADRTHTNHRYFEVDASPEPAERILDRFVRNGEGCIDHLAGYLDGFVVWRQLHDEGVEGVIRGDEGFGWGAMKTPDEVRKRVGLRLCADYADFAPLEREGMVWQQLPPHLEQRPGETNATWRDRLYHQFRIPVVLSALSDLKLGYVEQSCPLLSRRIVHAVRRLGDDDRTNKSAFRRVVRRLCPSVPIASKAAVRAPRHILASRPFAEVLLDSLASSDVKRLFPATFVQPLRDRLGRRHGIRHFRWIVEKVNRSGRNGLPHIDPAILAFRVHIVAQMHAMLNRDARRLSRLPKAACRGRAA